MKINRISAKTALGTCGIQGIDYAINPYTGCRHSCAYCYADFMRRFSGHLNERWGEFIDVKINLPDLLQSEIQKKKPGSVWLSSVTDCYQPIEAELKLTRKILETFNSHPRGKYFSLEVLTKSCLAERDFDLFRSLDVTFGMSVNSLNDDFVKRIEPFTSPPTRRIELIRKALANEIKAFAFIGPVLPGITDLEGLFNELSGAQCVFVEMLNTKSSVVKNLMPVVRRHFSDRLESWQLLLNNPQTYYEELNETVTKLSQKYDVPIGAVIRH